MRKKGNSVFVFSAGLLQIFLVTTAGATGGSALAKSVAPVMDVVISGTELPMKYDPAHPIKSAYSGQGFGLSGTGGALLAGLVWAVTAYSVVKMIGSFIGLDKESQRALEK